MNITITFPALPASLKPPKSVDPVQEYGLISNNMLYIQGADTWLAIPYVGDYVIGALVPWSLLWAAKGKAELTMDAIGEATACNGVTFAPKPSFLFPDFPFPPSTAAIRVVPSFPTKIKTAPSFTAPLSGWRAALSAASTDKTRDTIFGIACLPAKGNLPACVAGTDLCRLIIAPGKWEGSADPVEAIIPKPAAQALLKAFPKAGNLTFSFLLRGNEQWAVTELPGGGFYFIRNASGKYPNASMMFKGQPIYAQTLPITAITIAALKEIKAWAATAFPAKTRQNCMVRWEGPYLDSQTPDTSINRKVDAPSDMLLRMNLHRLVEAVDQGLTSIMVAGPDTALRLDGPSWFGLLMPMAK